MPVQHLTADDYILSDWGGGQTCQIFIYPGHSRYADRDFIFRISSATIRESPSTFTVLEDYDRILVSLEQAIELAFQDASFLLKPFVPLSFSGADFVSSTGTTTDFNVMMRKGTEAKLTILHNEAQYNIDLNPDCIQLWFVAKAEGPVTIGKLELAEKDSAVLHHTESATMHSTIDIVADKTAIIFQVDMYLDND
ncbi:Protein Ves [compost metagenome]